MNDPEYEGFKQAIFQEISLIFNRIKRIEEYQEKAFNCLNVKIDVFRIDMETMERQLEDIYEDMTNLRNRE